MNMGKTLFAQVMEFVPWKTFGRIIVIPPELEQRRLPHRSALMPSNKPMNVAHTSKQKGRSAARPALAESSLILQYKRKLTSTEIITGTGVLPFIAGLNLYLRTASKAFSSRPIPSARTTRGF